MTNTGYNYFLSRVLKPVSLDQGESGYFTSPTESLDPHLFINGNESSFRPEIRTWILNTLYQFWDSRYHNARNWSTVWIAGSGISYQWDSARGNGDLDVLIGVDWAGFYEANPTFRGFSEIDLAAIINQEFHQFLWPKTAETEFSSSISGGLKQQYEVTFYVNVGATDIRAINPYAAFNISDNTWTVKPPSGTDFTHPKEFYQYAEAERQTADRIVEQYNTAATAAASMHPGTPGWNNAMRQADLLVSQAQSLFEDIHLGRRQAFGPGGSGYGDYYNFRWQYHKQHGTVQALNAVGKAHQLAHSAFAESVYGAPIDAADVVLRRAAMVNR